MKTEFTQEDHSLLEILDQLARGGETALDGTTEVRECAEVLALLPHDLTLETPRVEVWRAIQAQVSADASARTESPGTESTPADAGTLVQFPTRPNTVGEPMPGSFSPGEMLAAPPVPVPIHRFASPIALAMAAALAFCLVGMGYLFANAQNQRTTIDALRADLTAADLRHQKMAQVREQYSMVTQTARQYYPLRPVSLRPEGESPHGRVWVCGAHQRWLLNVDKIAPAPRGYDYRFWFETQGGEKVNAGQVDIADGVGHLSASNMPMGTIGFFLTLEPRLEGEESRVLLHSGEAQDILLGIEESEGDLSLSM